MKDRVRGLHMHVRGKVAREENSRSGKKKKKKQNTDSQEKRSGAGAETFHVGTGSRMATI